MNETYRIRLAKENELYQLNTIEEAASKLFANTKFALEIDQDLLSIDLLREQQAKDLVWVAVKQKVRANKWCKFERTFSDQKSEIRYIREIIYGKRNKRT